MAKGKLFVVSGPSGAGKGTVCKKVIGHRTDLYFSVSCTTRGIRPGEIEGVHYRFITEAAFARMRDEGDLLECSHHNGAWYGTPRRPALEAMERGLNVLLEIENNGATQVIARHPQTVSVFILPPDRETLIKRLVYRGTEDLKKLEGRLRKVPSELSAAHEYTCLLLNDDADAAARGLDGILDGTYDTNAACFETLGRLETQFADMTNVLGALDEIYRQYQTQTVGGDLL